MKKQILGSMTTHKGHKKIGMGGMRVAPRLEGVVKNRGIKPVKKQKKESKGI